MTKNIKTGICDACEREVPIDNLKAIKEQYHGEVIARGTPGMVKNYYATVKLCSRCRLLRKVSIFVGVVLGCAYLMLWTFLYELVTHWALGVLWVVFNPLVIAIFVIVIFRVLTKCDTLIKTDFHDKEHHNYRQCRSNLNRYTPNTDNIKTIERGEVKSAEPINKEDIDETEAPISSVVDKTTYGIVKSWPLLDFAREYGKMQVGEFANKETGGLFKACIFTKPDGTRTFVAFAAKIGELSPKEIAAMKDELRVAQLESGNYSLYKPLGWEDVDLEMDNNKEPFEHNNTVEAYKRFKESKSKAFSERRNKVSHEKMEDSDSHIDVYTVHNKIVDTRKIHPTSPEGKFSIMDVRIDDSSWKVKKSFHNILEWKKYNLNDIRTIEYDKEKDIVKLIFKIIVDDGYDAIWFNRQYDKVHMTFYKQGEYVRGFDSEYDKAYTTLEGLFAAFCTTAQYGEDSTIVTLSGEAYKVNLIENYYNESMMRGFVPLDEK